MGSGPAVKERGSVGKRSGDGGHVRGVWSMSPSNLIK